MNILDLLEGTIKIGITASWLTMLIAYFGMWIDTVCHEWYEKILYPIIAAISVFVILIIIVGPIEIIWRLW